MAVPAFYLPPNEIVIRIANQTDLKESNINIAHELMHLILRSNGQDKSLNYIEIERKVDDLLTQKIFTSLLPGYFRQNFGK